MIFIKSHFPIKLQTPSPISEPKMQDLKLVLSKYIVRRRLDGGEFTYVYRPEGMSVPGKKQVMAVLKQDAKAFAKLMEESEVMETDDSDFESQILKIIPMLPYEDAVQTGLSKCLGTP